MTLREQFEAWILAGPRFGWSAHHLCRADDGYDIPFVHGAWSAWQAARAAALDAVLESLRRELDRRSAVFDAGTRLGLERATDIVRALIGAKE